MALKQFEDGDVLYAADLNEIVDQLAADSYTYSGASSGLSSLTLVFRRFGRLVEVSGSLSLDSSWSQGSKQTIIAVYAIPAAWRPPGSRVIPASLSSSGIHRGGDLVFSSSGGVIYGMSDTPPTSTAMLFSGCYLTS